MTWRWPWVSREETAESERCRAIAGHAWNHLALNDPRDVAKWIADARVEVAELRARLAELDAWKRAVDVAQRALDRTDAQYADLLARYHMLKLQGATTPEPERTLPAKQEDPVMAALNEVTAGKGQKVRKAALEQLKQDRAAKLTDEEIIVKIARGNRPAEEFA